ncbi:cyclin-domain-containing protein [Naematelia encephala]|uniref:Cyclin-domain-containing protein n=1 Tax=Naematelia encephala TaxID=71784 RepID=A0A1Y2AYG3_9TREE|nr:cyclin-domain-containing protein [Naematelia encephala]
MSAEDEQNAQSTSISTLKILDANHSSISDTRQSELMQVEGEVEAGPSRMRRSSSTGSREVVPQPLPPPPPSSSQHHHQQNGQEEQQDQHQQSLSRPSSPTTEVTSPPRPATPHLDLATYPTPTLLRLLAGLLQQIATANDQLRPDMDDEDTDFPTSKTHDDSGSDGRSRSDSRTSSSFPTHPSPTTALFASDPPADPALNHPTNLAGYDSHLFTASKASLDHPSALLAFHARHIPSISIEAYLLRILKYCPTTNEVFLGLLVYFDRMSRLGTPSGIGGVAVGVRKGFAIDSYNVHRLVIAGVTVASKFFSDVFYTNSRYAKVGGLPPNELNALELQFLLLNDFRLVIPPDEMQRYGDRLLGYWEGRENEVGVEAVVVPPPQAAPTIKPSQALEVNTPSKPPLAPPHPTPQPQATLPTVISAPTPSANMMRRSSNPPQAATTAVVNSSVTPRRERDKDRSIAFAEGTGTSMAGFRGWTTDDNAAVVSPMRE